MHAAIRNPLPTLYWLLPLIGLILLAQMMAPESLVWLRYQADVLERGELWRLLSAHGVHLSWQHALLNLGVLIVLVVNFPHRARPLFLPLAMLFIALAISLTFFAFTHVQWYVGLSGVLHGVIVLLAFSLWREQAWLSGALLLGLLLKLVWESRFGASAALEAQIGGPVLVEAHVYGAVAGLAPGVLALIKSRLVRS